jgi:UDP-GlcNAc:undecaprenyl-phosphate GlcNAc-1-phosphate transferase
MKTLLAFLTSFLVVFCSVPLFMALAARFKIVDIPGGRKIHKIPTPLLGGAAIYLGLSLGFIVNLSSLHNLWPFLISATLIFALGLANDIKELSAQLRLACQVLIALFFTLLVERISFFPPGLWGDTAEIVITVVWIVGITNAYNYLDGLDGLATGSAIINCFFFAAILFKASQYPVSLFLAILMASCLGFFPYNFKRAKIFLGEAGSTLLGFSLACAALMGNWAGDGIVKVCIPILILGAPIFDMVFTTVMRIKEGKVRTLLGWFSYANKDHFHHYLLDLGLHNTGAAVFIYFVSFSLGISAIMVSNDLAIEAFLTISQAAIIFGIIATLIVMGKRHRGGVV